MNFSQKKIEDYVFGRLSEDERAAFQFELIKNAELRKEVETLRTLKYISRAQKKKEKNRIIFFYPKRMWRVAAVFIGLITLAVLIALYNQRTQEAPSVDKENKEVENKIEQLVEEKEKAFPTN